MNIQTLEDFDVANKTVIVRADLNLPMKDSHIIDGLRIDRLIPTLKELARRQAKTVIISHFGRPNGRFSTNLSLTQVNIALGAALNRPPLPFSNDCIGVSATKTIIALEPGDIALLENLRFHKGEETNDPIFARELAKLGDLYVNDAFSCSHRVHASIVGITHHLPSAAGPAMIYEIQSLNKAINNPYRPLAAIIGGSKISTKIKTLENLIGLVDVLVIGGGMANTFLLAQEFDVGKSLCEPEMVKIASNIMKNAKKRNCKIVLPIDVVIAEGFHKLSKISTVPVTAIPNDQMVFDIGPKSTDLFISNLTQCNTLVWNGPLGAFEVEPFDRGTSVVAKKIATLAEENKILGIAGGGDTIAALTKAGVSKKFSYTSTAGGAFLAWLEGKSLPGVTALSA